MQTQDERKFDPSPLYTSPADLERVLFSITQPNTEVVKESTAILKEFFKKQESITCLIQQIAESTKPEVRQMAAVYLRDQVDTFWKRLPEDMQANIKSFLLQRLVGEATNAERLAVGAVVSSIGRMTVPKGKWNDLLPALEQLCAPDKAQNVREVAFLLWRNLVTYCGTSIKPKFLTILQILDQGLQDQTSGKVQVEAVKTIGAMVEFVDNEDEVSVLRGFIPKMVKVVENCLERQEEDHVVAGMTVFTDLMESQIPILSQHGLELCHFMARICAAKDLPLTVRRQGASFLSWAVKSRPKTIVKHQLVQPLIQLCANLIIESQGYDPDDIEAGGEDVRLSGSTLGPACDLLDEVFLNVPVETSFPLAISATEALYPSDDRGQRKSAFVTMAMMAEGCAEIIVKDNNLENLLRRCVAGLEDPDQECRKCACEALTQLATHVPIEILKFHEMIMRPLFQLLKSDTEQLRVKERALGTVEMMVEDIDEPAMLRPYLSDLMQTLAFCMNIADKSIQEQALSTLSSVASTAKEDFHPFFDQVVGLLKQIISITDPEMLSLRGEATACLGAVATAVGRERFTPVMHDLHPIILAGLELEVDVADVRENSFMYFADLASILGPELYNLENFRDVLDHILVVMEDDDGMMVKLPDDGFGDAQPPIEIDDEDLMEGAIDLQELDEDTLREMVAQAEAEDEDEIDETLGEIRTLKLQVQSGFMEEKAAAIHALTQIAKFCGPAFLQTLEDVWEHILILWEYPHALVKIALSGCIQEILKLVLKTMHNTTKLPWMPGDTSIKYDDNTNKLINDIYPNVIQAIHDEDDRDALTVILDNFMEQLKMLGPSSVQPYMEELCRAINLFLKEKTACFSSKNEDEDAKQIAGKHRWVADSVAELIGVLAQLWGPQFVGQFQEFFPNILAFADQSRHPHDQAMAAGCIADVTSYLAHYNNVMNPFAQDSFQLAVRVAQSEETNMRQNGLYLIGALWTACDQSCTLPFAQSCLQIVGQYIQFPNEGDRAQTLVRDNAVSALGKMMLSDPDTVPFSQYLETWLRALPLTSDFSENKYIYQLLIDLVVKHTNVMEQYMQLSLGLLADGLVTNNTEEDTKRQIAVFFKNTQSNPSFGAVIQSLPQNLQQAVAQASAAV